MCSDFTRFEYPRGGFTCERCNGLGVTRQPLTDAQVAAVRSGKAAALYLMVTCPRCRGSGEQDEPSHFPCKLCERVRHWSHFRHAGMWSSDVCLECAFRSMGGWSRESLKARAAGLPFVCERCHRELDWRQHADRQDFRRDSTDTLGNGLGVCKTCERELRTEIEDHRRAEHEERKARRNARDRARRAAARERRMTKAHEQLPPSTLMHPRIEQARHAASYLRWKITNKRAMEARYLALLAATLGVELSERCAQLNSAHSRQHSAAVLPFPSAN